MGPDQPFRWLFVAIFLLAFSLSGYFRQKARRSGEVIPRAREGKLGLALRLLFAAGLYLSMLAYMVSPDWMSWSSMRLPAWVRWLGAAVGLAAIPMLYWVLHSLGRNISETYFTKEGHVLVTRGPYRWVRHPLYVVATIAFVSLGILAANWFITAMALVAAAGIRLLVIPREEAQLLNRFGTEYREYMTRTGRLGLRLRRPSGRTSGGKR